MERNIVINKVEFKQRKIEIDHLGDVHEMQELEVDFYIIVNEKEVHSTVTFNHSEVDYKYIPAIRQKLIEIIFRGDSNGR